VPGTRCGTIVPNSSPALDFRAHALGPDGRLEPIRREGIALIPDPAASEFTSQRLKMRHPRSPRESVFRTLADAAAGLLLESSRFNGISHMQYGFEISS